MKTFVSISVLAIFSAFAIASDAAPQTVPAPAAASSAVKPAPRTSNVAEAAQKATVPGELRPENPVVPQLQIPLRRDAGEPPVTAASGRAVVRGGIDDSAARCQAQGSDSARAACHARAAAQPASAVR